MSIGFRGGEVVVNRFGFRLTAEDVSGRGGGGGGCSLARNTKAREKGCVWGGGGRGT